MKRTRVRHKRIHDYAAERYADAQSAGAVRFWRGVMNACTKTESHLEPIPHFWDRTY